MTSRLLPEPLCRRCNRPIVVNAANAEVFENMHWLCFHLEYEHRADPDEACQDPSCPWLHIRFYRGALQDHGIDPDDALQTELARYFTSTP